MDSYPDDGSVEATVRKHMAPDAHVRTKLTSTPPSMDSEMAPGPQEAPNPKRKGSPPGALKEAFPDATR
jgi:hypothetical protein